MNIKGYSNIEGIVLKTLAFKETSLIVYLYTKEGIKSIIVKGAKKYKERKLMFCTPLTRVKAITNKSEFPTLIDYSILDDYLILKRDLKKSLWSQYLLSILSKIEDISFNEQVYNLLINTFELAKTCDIEILILTVLIKLTKAYGINPVLKTCVICNSNKIEFFSISEGGALCLEHKSSDAYDTDILKTLKELYYINICDLDNSSYKNLKELYDCIIKYYEWHLNIKLDQKDTLFF